MTGLAQCQLVLAWVTELPAAIILLIEVIILSAGVTARYGLGRPLVWSDELSITLFLWLAMLGAVIAVQRSEHMRLTFVIARAPLRWLPLIDTFCTIVLIAFLIGLFPPSIAYTRNQAVIITEGLHIPVAVTSAALPTGIILMTLVLLIRVLERSTWRQAAASLIAIGVIVATLFALRPLLIDIGNYDLVVFFVVLVMICVLLGIPIAFAFGVATFSYLSLVTNVPLTIVVNRMSEGMSDFILLSIPLFI